MLHVLLDEWFMGTSHHTSSYCPTFAGTLAVCVSNFCLGVRLGGMVYIYSR